MSKISPNSKRQILSPKPPLKHLTNRSVAIQNEYQLKSIKPKITKQKSLFTQEKSGSQTKISLLTPRRKLSFKKVITNDLMVDKNIQIQSKDRKSTDKMLTNEELLRALQYNQLGSQSKQNNQAAKLGLGISNDGPRRLRRIKSNDSYSRMSKLRLGQTEDRQALSKAKLQNNNLKLLRFQSSKILTDLQNEYAEEKELFKKQQKSYQRKIQMLKRKIQMNKTEICHLFTYQVFDPTKLIIKPIVQVDGESSLVRSCQNSSQFKQLQQTSRICENQLISVDGKEGLTETTGPTSRQSCGDIDQF